MSAPTATVRVRATAPTATISLTWTGAAMAAAPHLGDTIRIGHPRLGLADAVVVAVEVDTDEATSGTGSYAAPVSGAALSAEASEPGYAAPELRAEVAKPRTIRGGGDTTCTVSSSGVIGTARYTPPRTDGVGEVQVRVGAQAAPVHVATVHTGPDGEAAAVVVTTIRGSGGATARKFLPKPADLPENSVPLPAGTTVPDRFVEIDLWPWPAVRAAVRLIDPAQVRIAMDRDQLTVSGPLCASAKADPEAAFRSLPDLRPAADKPAHAAEPAKDEPAGATRGKTAAWRSWEAQRLLRCLHTYTEDLLYMALHADAPVSGLIEVRQDRPHGAIAYEATIEQLRAVVDVAFARAEPQEPPASPDLRPAPDAKPPT